MLLKLAMRNLVGAGAKTWLNALMLSMCYVVVILAVGVYEGMTQQVGEARIRMELGGGQYWHPDYNPNDLFTLQEAHGRLPRQLRYLVEKARATPVLIREGAVYLNGVSRSVLLKGVDPEQMVLEFPSKFLVHDGGITPAMIGARMAESTHLREGDEVVVRWRDVQGVFNARRVIIVRVMGLETPAVAHDAIWLPLQELQTMSGTPSHATMVVVNLQETQSLEPSWPFHDHHSLLTEQRGIVQIQALGSKIFCAVLLFLVLLFLFNTQAQSVFHRRREIGALIALGMRRREVVRLFTLEGALHGVLAALLGAIYGVPIMFWTVMEGVPMPRGGEVFSINESLYPIYSLELIVVTGVVILISAVLVSWLPSRKIAVWCVPDALKGKAV